MQRAGEYITNLSGEAEYKSFRPTPLPIEINMDAEMISLLTDATKALATLDTLSSYIPNMNLFVSMYVRKEALLSSQIEGTQATLEDVLDPLIEKMPIKMLLNNLCRNRKASIQKSMFDFCVLAFIGDIRAVLSIKVKK